MKTITCIGRGGSGKTSFVALMTKYFIEKGNTPLLLVDLDSDQNLAEMIGIDLKDQHKNTISELLYTTFLDEGGTLVGISPSERMEGKIWEKGLYEAQSFDFIAVGTKFIEGCYCLPDAALKRALERLTKIYKFVLIDSPAGLEHLNRRIASNVDDIFDLIDPSRKSFNHVKRAHKIIKEVKISYNNFYVVGGYRFPKDMETEVEKKTGMRYIGKINYDKNVENYVLNGKSLLDLPSSSPAYNSVKEVLARAGY